MSIKLMSLVFEAEGLSPVHKLVMLALCDYAADDGTSIYPSLRTLAKKTSLKDSTVRKALNELRDPAGIGLLVIAAASTNRFPNRYAVDVKRLKSLSWVLPDSTQALPDSTQGATTWHPRVSPHSTDPSLDPSVDPPIEKGLSNPDFDRACAILKEGFPVDFAQASPVLLESDEKPFRLLVKVESLPPEFIDRLGAALRSVNPRRNYHITYQTSGTGHKAASKPSPAAPVPEPAASVTPEYSEAWLSIAAEFSLEINAATAKRYVTPSRLVSVNGAWRIAVPDRFWWQRPQVIIPIERIARGILGHSIEFEFVEG
jgi:hypothetical protein